jgi:hypothetical protein
MRSDKVILGRGGFKDDPPLIPILSGVAVFG